ncbi:MAG: hypothetical protein PVJ75_14950, partial [Chloroflexota bacterium]
QEQFAEDSRFRNMPVRLEGVIGVPAGERPHPVVLIMHGSHVLCPTEDIWPCSPEEEQKNYVGFTYLVEELAKAGYVALSINLNAEHTYAYGESPVAMRTRQLIDLHLGELVAANVGESDRFGVDLEGRVDLAQIVWLGHSRGGDIANQIVREQGLEQSASPLGYGPVNALLLVAPAVFTLDALPVVDLPFAVVIPTCDGDVANLSGTRFYESARLDGDRSQLALSVYLEGANHNSFNSILDAERIGDMEDRPDCAEGNLLTAVAQQTFLSQFAIDFLETIFGQPDQAAAALERLGMDTTMPLPTSYDNVAVRVSFLPTSTNQLTILEPQSGAELSQNLLGGAVYLNGVTAQFCPEGYYVPANEPGSEPCKRVNFNQPGYPQEFVFGWDSPDAEWRMEIPESEADLSGATAFQFRVGLDPLSELNKESEPQSLTVELVDSSGKSARVISPPIEFPIGQRQSLEQFEGDFFSGHVYLNSVRIPLAEFEDVDLMHITEIALVLDQTPSGTLFIADLAFVME